jgi:small-conductance mechanosensitive channel/CRP-like cAMP-binding protein
LKNLVFALVFLASLALMRLPVGALERRLRRAPGSWDRYVRPLLLPLHLTLAATAIHGVLLWRHWASNVSAFTTYATFAWLVFRALTTLIFEWWYADVRGVVIPSVVRRVVAFGLGLAGVLTALNVVLEVSFLDLAVLTGAAAIVAGLLFQGVTRDAVLGVSMVLERRVVVGDYLRLDQHEGEVISLDWKSTRLRTPDGDEVVLPNRLVVDSAIVRYHRAARQHRVSVEVDVPGVFPPNAALDVLRSAAASTRSVLRDPSPVARLVGGASGTHQIEVLFWIENAAAQAQAASDARSVFWYRLRRAGLVAEASLSTPEETRAALASVPLFGTLVAEQLERLARSVSVQRFGRGEVLFRQGDPGSALFVVLSGQLDILVEKTDSPDRPERIASVGTGNFIGEHALMTGEARSATAVAADDTVVVVIEKADILEVLHADAELAGRIAEVMAERDGAARERQSHDRAHAASSLLGRIRKFFALSQ